MLVFSDMRQKLRSNPRQAQWAIVAMWVVASAIYAASMPDWVGYLQSWGGTMFRAMSGAIMGWLVSRYVMGLDLSDIKEEHRSLAAVSQAIVIGAFVIGVANGA